MNFYTEEELKALQNISPYFKSFVVGEREEKDKGKKFACEIKKSFIHPVYRVFHDILNQSEFKSGTFSNLLITPPLSLNDNLGETKWGEIVEDLKEAHYVLFEEDFDDLPLYSDKRFSYAASFRIELGK